MTDDLVVRIEALEQKRELLREEVDRLKRRLEDNAVAMEGWRAALAYRDAEIDRLLNVLQYARNLIGPEEIIDAALKPPTSRPRK